LTRYRKVLAPLNQRPKRPQPANNNITPKPLFVKGRIPLGSLPVRVVSGKNFLKIFQIFSNSVKQNAIFNPYIGKYSLKEVVMKK